MGRAPVVEIVQAIADAKGIDPRELEYPLEKYVDTEAIRLLKAHKATSWTLSFELPEHDVTVSGDGVIQVEDQQREIQT